MSHADRHGASVCSVCCLVVALEGVLSRVGLCVCVVFGALCVPVLCSLVLRCVVLISDTVVCLVICVAVLLGCIVDLCVAISICCCVA